MSQTTNTTKRTPEEFAKNYKSATSDGIFGPIAVGNINQGKNSKGELRTIINLCMKTAKSGERNATYSQPADWKVKVQTGEFVNVQVVDGYVTKLMPIMAKSLTSKVAQAIEDNAGAENAAQSAKEIIAAAEVPQAELAPAGEEEDAF